MRIEIVDGKSVVTFRKREQESLREALRLCTELEEWLPDEHTKAASEALGPLVAKYAGDKSETPS